MTTFCLEMRSTADWNDLRYREYTSSRRKAELFQKVPRISFTDSGHGIVPHVREYSGRREPLNMMLANYVQEHITRMGREVKLPRGHVHSDVVEALTQALDYFEDREDVNDGSYGEPSPNREMSLAQLCRDALARLGH